MIYASIDIGSNTILLLIGEIVQGKIKVIFQKSSIVGLGKKIDEQGLLKSKMDFALSVLQEYCGICQQLGAKKIIVTATEACRVAGNKVEFLDRVERETGLKIQIITPEGEAYYTALGIAGAQGTSIMDLGGASTELIHFRHDPFEIVESISLPVGSVRAADWLSDHLFEKNMEIILQGNALMPYCGENIIGVGGTLTTLGALFLKQKNYDDDQINGFEFNQAQLEELIKELNCSPDEILRKFPVVEKRVDTIYAGAMVTLHIMQKIGLKKIRISNRGLRFGTFIAGFIDKKFLFYS